MEVSKVFCNFWAPWVAHILPLAWYFFLLKNTHKWFMQRGSVGGNKKKIIHFWILKVFILPLLFSEHFAKYIVFVVSFSILKDIVLLSFGVYCCWNDWNGFSEHIFVGNLSLSLLSSLPDNFHDFIFNTLLFH